VQQLLAALFLLVSALASSGQEPAAKKVFMITDLEGVDGIFDSELQCIPFQSPRFEESRTLLTGVVNAAVDALFEGGATDVVVWDGHDSGRTLSTLDLNPRARLLGGRPVSPTLELDSSYAAVLFIGQHAMAGAEKGILSHSYSSEGIQNIWVNNKPVGEIGGRVMLAGAFVLDGRIRGAAFDHMLVSYHSVVTHRVHRDIYESVVPGVVKAYDLPDLVAALAPKPVWLVDAVDPLGEPVPLEETRKQYSSSIEAFKAARAETALHILTEKPEQHAQAF
jgi:hypothetical protein